MFMVSTDPLAIYGIWEQEFQSRLRDLITNWG